MMREILFRGKAINRNRGYHRTKYKNGDWVYGLVTKLYDERFETLPAEMTNTDGVSGIDVDYRSIGQYTGLTDKNGKKIFEGDIVTAPYIDPIFHSRWNEGNPTENTVVKYADGVFYIEYIESKHKITLFGLLDGEKEAEVIGNIYDNPELMRGGEQ